MDNPQAFPRLDSFNGSLYSDPGMTLRDWFAGQAIVALPHLVEGMTWRPSEAARDAYRIADAMLSERARNLKLVETDNAHD